MRKRIKRLTRRAFLATSGKIGAGATFCSTLLGTFVAACFDMPEYDPNWWSYRDEAEDLGNDSVSDGRGNGYR